MATQREAEDQRNDGGGRELTIMEHLNELRGRLFRSALAVAAGTILGLVIANRTLKFLEKPAERAHPGFRLQYLQPLEYVGAYFKVAILIGLIVAMPVLMYQLLAFIVPGLTKKERRWLYPILAGTIGLFSLGIVFSYFFVVPKVLDFVLNFGNGVADPHITVNEYLNFITHLVFWTGIFFETPIVMMAPAKFGMISAKRYLSWWRYAIVAGFVAAAAVIPNINPLQQIVVAAPIIGLYFIGCGLAWLVQPKKKANAE